MKSVQNYFVLDLFMFDFTPDCQGTKIISENYEEALKILQEINPYYSDTNILHCEIKTLKDLFTRPTVDHQAGYVIAKMILNGYFNIELIPTLANPFHIDVYPPEHTYISSVAKEKIIAVIKFNYDKFKTLNKVIKNTHNLIDSIY